MASAVEQALAKQFAGNGTMFMPATSVNDMYAGILPSASRTNPLVPSQGGSWPASQPQRPRSTALTPQNYTPSAPPHIPNDPRRATAEMKMLPFPPAYPNDKPPIDITVRGGNQQIASVPMPQRRPWNAPNEMDLAAMAAQEAGAMQPQVASAYAPEPPQNPAVAAAMAGLSPLSASERIKQPAPGQGAAYASPRDMSRAQMYDATNAAAAQAARTQDRSGIGTDGYVRDASGTVVGRDAKYQGMNPDQMYNAISGRQQDDSWKSIGSSASSAPGAAKQLGFSTTAAMERAMGPDSTASAKALLADQRQQAINAARSRAPLKSNGLVNRKGRM